MESVVMAIAPVTNPIDPTVYRHDEFENGLQGTALSVYNTSFDGVANNVSTAQIAPFGYQGQGAVVSTQNVQSGNTYSTFWWNIPSSPSQSYTQYLNVPSYPMRSTPICQVTGANGTPAIAVLMLRPDGRLAVFSSMASTAVALVVSNSPVPLGQWFMAVLTVNPDSINGFVKVDIYSNPSAATPSDSISASQVAIPGVVGRVIYGIDTRLNETWNIDVVTNLGASSPWGTSVADRKST